MKKIHSILLGMGLITGGLMLAGWTSGETVTLEEIDTATQTEQLLKNHSSFQITSVYVDDDFTYSQYVDKDLLLVSYPDSTELYLDGQLNYLSEEDSLSGILYILQDPVAYPATDNVIFSSSAAETITSCEEKDGKIYVSSDASPEDTEKQVTGEGFPYNEGEYFITDYVLDAETTPDVRKEAALQAQKELADCMQVWGISLLDAPVPEQMKYASLAEAASHLMQVLNDPERIIG